VYTVTAYFTHQKIMTDINMSTTGLACVKMLG